MILAFNVNDSTSMHFPSNFPDSSYGILPSIFTNQLGKKSTDFKGFLGFACFGLKSKLFSSHNIGICTIILIRWTELLLRM